MIEITHDRVKSVLLTLLIGAIGFLGYNYGQYKVLNPASVVLPLNKNEDGTITALQLIGISLSDIKSSSVGKVKIEDYKALIDKKIAAPLPADPAPAGPAPVAPPAPVATPEDFSKWFFPPKGGNRTV